MDVKQPSSVFCRLPLGRGAEETDGCTPAGLAAQRKAFFEEFFGESQSKAEHQHIIIEGQEDPGMISEKVERGEREEKDDFSDISPVTVSSSPETETEGHRLQSEAQAVKEDPLHFPEACCSDPILIRNMTSITSWNTTPNNTIPVVWGSSGCSTSTSEIVEVEMESVAPPSSEGKRNKLGFSTRNLWSKESNKQASTSCWSGMVKVMVWV